MIKRLFDFLDAVPFPTGVLPWRDGALIATAPDLALTRKTQMETARGRAPGALTGFNRATSSIASNGFEYGLDNWIYCANGDSGGSGEIDADRATVNISGRDFRFRPESGELQAIEGQTQYGRRCDDWGNWFGNNKSNLVVALSRFPERYVVRNLARS
jgi:hypothetical protein